MQFYPPDWEHDRVALRDFDTSFATGSIYTFHQSDLGVVAARRPSLTFSRHGLTRWTNTGTVTAILHYSPSHEKLAGPSFSTTRPKTCPRLASLQNLRPLLAASFVKSSHMTPALPSCGKNSNTMKTTLLVSLAAVALLLSCYAFISVVQLRSDLGETRYAGISPELTLRVLAGEWEKPATEYTSSKYRFRGVLVQNGTFPVSSYSAYVKYHIVLANGHSESEGILSDIKDGTGAFEATVTAYDISSKVLSKKPEIKLDGVIWQPLKTGLIKLEDTR